MSNVFKQLIADLASDDKKKAAIKEREALMQDMANRDSSNKYSYDYPAMKSIYGQGYPEFEKLDRDLSASPHWSDWLTGSKDIGPYEINKLLKELQPKVEHSQQIAKDLYEDNKHSGARLFNQLSSTLGMKDKANVPEPKQIEIPSYFPDIGVFGNPRGTMSVATGGTQEFGEAMAGKALYSDLKAKDYQDFFKKLSDIYSKNPNVTFEHEPEFDNTNILGAYNVDNNKIGYANGRVNRPDQIKGTILHEKLHSDTNIRNTRDERDNPEKLLFGADSMRRWSQSNEHFMNKGLIPETMALKYLREAMKKEGKTGITEQDLEKIKDLSYYNEPELDKNSGMFDKLLSTIKGK